MAKATTLNNKNTSKGKRIFTKAEYAVASTLNKLRFEQGSSQKKVDVLEGKWAGNEKVEFQGSYFFTTDQMADHYMGETWFTRENRMFDFDKDNIQDDVDLILSDLYKCGRMEAVKHKGMKISVKQFDRAATSGKVNLEICTYNPETKEERAGWATNGNSDFTAMVIGHKMLLVNSRKLKVLASDPTTPHQLFENLSYERVQENVRQGRYFTDAKNLVVPIEDVIKECDGIVVDMIDWWKPIWSKHVGADTVKVQKRLWERLV